MEVFCQSDNFSNRITICYVIMVKDPAQTSMGNGPRLNSRRLRDFVVLEVLIKKLHKRDVLKIHIFDSRGGDRPEIRNMHDKSNDMSKAVGQYFFIRRARKMPHCVRVFRTQSGQLHTACVMKITHAPAHTQLPHGVPAVFALLRPASAPLAAKIRTAYFGINTAGSDVNLMRPWAT